MRYRPVVLALIAGLLAPGCPSRPARVVIGVGVTESSHVAVRLAAREIAAAGGAGGVAVEFTGLDWNASPTLPEPTVVLDWARRFNETEGLIAVIGHSDSASTLSAAAAYNRDGIPQIVTIATNPAITNIGSWTYRLCLSDAAQGPALADYAVTELGKRRIAMIFVNDDYGRGIAQSFERQARERGAGIVTAVMHRNVLQPDDKDAIVRALAEMKALTHPDLVVLFQRQEAGLWTLQALKDAGVDADVLGGDNFAQPAVRRTDPTLLGRLRLSLFFRLDPANPATAQFRKAFNAFAGQDPDYGQAFAYDAVCVLREAIEHGYYTRAGVKDYLDRLIRNQTPISGVTGTFTIGHDHDARRSFYIAEIRDKEFHVVKQLPPR